jgi:hypothetical protein
MKRAAKRPTKRASAVKRKSPTKRASAIKRASATKSKSAPKKAAAKKPAPRRGRGGRPHGIVQINPKHLVGLVSHASTAGAIAPGFTPQRGLNLKFKGGRTLPDLSYRIFYLDAARWADSDMQNIDASLSGAMTDPPLNNVIQQYFPDGPIRTTFLGSSRLNGAVEATFDRDNVNPVISGLIDDGTLGGVDFDTTVICLMLPPGAILSTDAAGGVGKLVGDDDADSSQEGLGGYHGSCHIGDQRVYFAVGVFSQFIDGQPNGIPVFADPWKNVVATFYHELCEARTDPDVEDANRNNDKSVLGWYADVDGGGEIGDIPMNEAGEAGNLRLVMVEVRLANGNTAPIQLMWSNAVAGPQGPFG